MLAASSAFVQSKKSTTHYIVPTKKRAKGAINARCVTGEAQPIAMFLRLLAATLLLLGDATGADRYLRCNPCGLRVIHGGARVAPH